MIALITRIIETLLTLIVFAVGYYLRYFTEKRSSARQERRRLHAQLSGSKTMYCQEFLMYFESYTYFHYYAGLHYLCKNEPLIGKLNAVEEIKFYKEFMTNTRDTCTDTLKTLIVSRHELNKTLSLVQTLYQKNEYLSDLIGHVYDFQWPDVQPPKFRTEDIDKAVAKWEKWVDKEIEKANDAIEKFSELIDNVLSELKKEV